MVCFDCANAGSCSVMRLPSLTGCAKGKNKEGRGYYREYDLIAGRRGFYLCLGDKQSREPVQIADTQGNVAAVRPKANDAAICTW